LLPNLYVFLIGPPALGKGVAIKLAHNLYRECGGIHSFKGQTSAAHLTDILGKVQRDDQGRKILPRPRLWLVMEEVANDILGPRNLIEAFVKMMTELYTSSGDMMDTGTRTHGGFRIENPCINWLVGTTEKWMIDTFTEDMIHSGFASRIVFVYGKYSDRRYYRPQYPDDIEAVRQHIIARFHAMHYVEGKFLLTPAAEIEEKQWYMNRKEPMEKILKTTWRREHDLVLKLAMLLSLADGGPLVIDAHHIIRATKLSASVQPNVSDVVVLSRRVPAADVKDDIEERIRKAKEITHSDLLRSVSSQGITTKALQNIVMTLNHESKVEYDRTQTGGRIYRWVKQIDNS